MKKETMWQWIILLVTVGSFQLSLHNGQLPQSLLQLLAGAALGRLDAFLRRTFLGQQIRRWPWSCSSAKSASWSWNAKKRGIYKLWTHIIIYIYNYHISRRHESILSTQYVLLMRVYYAYNQRHVVQVYVIQATIRYTVIGLYINLVCIYRQMHWQPV